MAELSQGSMTENPSPESTEAVSSEQDQENFDFDQLISEAEEKIESLKVRRASIESRKKNYMNLKVDTETLKDIELSKEITEKLEKAEYGLFTELVELVGEEHLAWKKTGEGFWTFFRYAGIGFAIAVILHRVIN